MNGEDTLPPVPEADQVAAPQPPVTPPVPTPAPAFAGSDWQGRLIFATGLGAVLWGLVSAIGTGWGLWPWRSGLAGVTWSFFLAIAVIFAGVVLGQRARKTGLVRPYWLRWAGMAAAIVYAGWIGTYIVADWTSPAIHDISTDLADPPGFRELVLRSDNWDDIPGVDDPEMAGMNPQQRWQIVHREAYGDIRSVRIDEPVPSVVAKAERLANARGWDVVTALPEEGRFEATETRTLFRLKDDIVLRVRPTETGEGSIVDMRSVSRVGVSDLGANAARVRSFLADLSGTVTAAP